MVKCGTCTECCKGFDPIWLLPAEMGFKEQRIDGARALQHKFNGDCVYLGDKGCTIHETKPFACRLYDCRDAVPKSMNARPALVAAAQEARRR